MRKGRLLLAISAVALVLIFAGVLFLGRLEGPGRTVHQWLAERTFRSGQKAVHSSAAKALVDMDPRAALEVFIAVELSELKGNSFESSHGYLEFQHVPLFLVADLAAMLDEPDPYRATVAAYGIEMLCKTHPGYSFAEAVPGLTRILASPDRDCSVAAAHAIAALGDRAPRAKRLLIECFRSGAITKSRLMVGMQLTKAEVLALSGGLSHPDTQVRSGIAWMLMHFPEHHDVFEQPLRKLLSDPDLSVVQQAFIVLERCLPAESLVEVAADLLRREDARRFAVEWLEVHLSTAGTWTAIKKASSQPSTRGWMLGIIERRPGDVIPTDLIPELLEICRTDKNLRCRAVLKLGHMGSRARSAVPEIRDLQARETNETFAEHAESAIREIEGTH